LPQYADGGEKEIWSSAIFGRCDFKQSLYDKISAEKNADIKKLET